MTRFLLGFFSFGWLRGLDFLPPLLLRLFLAPLLWVSGSNKLGLFSAADSDWLNPLTWVDMNAYASTVEALKASALPIPFPELMAWVIPGIEIVGAILLLIGFAVRWISLPILVLVVGTLVMMLSGKDIAQVAESFVATHGYIDPETNSLSQILTYLIMFLTLFFMGAGRYFSIDWMLYHKLQLRLARIKASKATLVNDPFAVNATTRPS
ncbi:DoxX family protein [Leucothrix mucor]|uniref:DoxX family protein n=1 Tax=Leucothrix mucor TaxID=45248 RepID=UPI0003B3DCEB|nr:DoxX family protein [Leucothrix mucor]